jgi:hypothetical protein
MELTGKSHHFLILTSVDSPRRDLVVDAKNEICNCREPYFYTQLPALTYVINLYWVIVSFQLLVRALFSPIVPRKIQIRMRATSNK